MFITRNPKVGVIFMVNFRGEIQVPIHTKYMYHFLITKYFERNKPMHGYYMYMYVFSKHCWDIVINRDKNKTEADS